MEPMLQRFGDVTIQRLEKPKDNKSGGSQENTETTNKEESSSSPDDESNDEAITLKRAFPDSQISIKRFKFDDKKPIPDDSISESAKKHLDNSVEARKFASETSESEISDFDSDSDLESEIDLNLGDSKQLSKLNSDEDESTNTSFLDKLVDEPFGNEEESETTLKPPDNSADGEDYDFDIKEKLKEMGEISFQTVKKGEKPKKVEVSAENEVVVTPARKPGTNDEETLAERKGLNLRRNIREVMDETKLDESTLAAQRQEMERLQRVQEQQRLLREFQRQAAQERMQHKVLSLLQGNNFSKPGTSATTRIGNTVLVKLPNGQTKPMTKLPKRPFDLVRVQKSAGGGGSGVGSSGIGPGAGITGMGMPSRHRSLLANVKPGANLTPSVSIAPVAKKIPPVMPKMHSDSESDDEARRVQPPKPKDPVPTIDISSDEDCIVVSEPEADGDDTEDDPSNSGMHTNDEFNQPDEQGRVVVNIGHPDNEPDIFVAPQIARIIKPHQIGGVRFLYDNVVESTTRFEGSAGFGCILAHSMGLGKTLQVVCFSDIFLRHTPAKTILCIMPINTLQNWMAEYNMWLPIEDNVGSSPLIAHGEVRPRNFNLHVLNDSHKTLAARAKVIHAWKEGGGVLLIGYEQFRLLSLRKYPKSRRKTGPIETPDDDKNKVLFDEVHEALVKPGPDLVICDEGHRIKNSHASISQALKQMRTKRRIVLTGYPLQNNLMEYWCMVDFVRPNYLGSKTEFCNMFERPIMNGQCIDSTEADIKLMRYRAHVLHSLLVGFVQRRSHAVLQTALPQKEEYVLLVRMLPFQRKLYETFMDEVVRSQAVPNPLKAFAVCCKIWNHPDVLYNFLKKRARGDAVDIDLEEVGSTAGSTTESGTKPKKAPARTRKPAKGKNGAKPAASVTPYNTITSEQPATTTTSNNASPNTFNFPSQSSQQQQATQQPQQQQVPSQQVQPQQMVPPQLQQQVQPQQQQQVQPEPQQQPQMQVQQQQQQPQQMLQSQMSPQSLQQMSQSQQLLPQQQHMLPQQQQQLSQQSMQLPQQQQQLQSQIQQNLQILPSQHLIQSQPQSQSQQLLPTQQQQSSQQSQMLQPNSQTLQNQSQILPTSSQQQTPVDNTTFAEQANNFTNEFNNFQQNPSYFDQPPQSFSQNFQNKVPNSFDNNSTNFSNSSTSSFNQKPNFQNNFPNENSNSNFNQTSFINNISDNSQFPSTTQNYNQSSQTSNRAGFSGSFDQPNNFSNFQQNYWGQQNDYGRTSQQQQQQHQQQHQQQQQSSQQNELYNCQNSYNPNFSSNNANHSWIKKEEVKSALSSPLIKTENSNDSKPKINIISDIKLPSVFNSADKKIKILSDIKIEPKMEELDIKTEIKSEIKEEIKSELKNELQPEEDGKQVETSPLAKLSIKDLKEDSGIPYDWAIELLKDYVPGCIENSAKMEILFCIIRESIALGDRLLVFSQSLITLDLIEQFLQMNLVPGDTFKWARNTSYYRLDGSTSALEREKLINEFNSNPKIHLFLVSTRAGSLGINLVGANRVVVLDASWNPCHDTQAVCRVYRYGQRKPCFVYRLVVDNCLEKKIYDRQINKQGMSDRVVDECNPDAHLTMKDVSTLCWDDKADEGEEKEWGHVRDNYIDVVLQKVIENHGRRLNKEPFQHESLLVDRKEKQLSQQEKRLAKKGYEREKQAARQPTYNMLAAGRGHRPVASVRPMQQGNERPSRWIPAEHWQRQGMTAQEMTLPLDVVIPTNQPEKGNIVLKAGQKVLVLKSPKGVYMQLESGKIVAIKTAIKVKGKAEDNNDPTKMPKPHVPPTMKVNPSLSVMPQKRVVKPFTPGVAKMNVRSIRQSVPNLVSRMQNFPKRDPKSKFPLGNLDEKLLGSQRDHEMIPGSSSDEELLHGDRNKPNLDITITSRNKYNNPGELDKRISLLKKQVSVRRIGPPGHALPDSKHASVLQRLEHTATSVVNENRPFQETLDSITSSYKDDVLEDDVSVASSNDPKPTQLSSDASDHSDEVTYVSEQPPPQPPPSYPSSTMINQALPEQPKTEMPNDYYNNYYNYNMQPYHAPPPPPQNYGYPPPQPPPPYDMMNYPPQPPPQQPPPPPPPQYNYGYPPPQGYPPPPAQPHYPPPPPPPQGGYDYNAPPPQPMYGGYQHPYPPQQYPPPPPPQMYAGPQAGNPPPPVYPDYQYPQTQTQTYYPNT